MTRLRISAKRLGTSTAKSNDAMKAKPHNDGQWTSARYRSFIMSALRGARWGPKYSVIRRAYVKDGVNPATGRKCKLHRCEDCQELFPAKDMQADHINPVIPVTGFDCWDNVIERLFCEVDGYRALCKGCHSEKTKKENAERRKNKH